jgi:hypothetical protein
MFADAILLGWMATSYKYVDYTTGNQHQRLNGIERFDFQ